MKSFTTATITASFLGLFFSACKKDSLLIDKEANFNTPFTSSVNEHIALTNQGTQVVVQIKNISDQRCPNPLGCNDPGSATVRVEITNTQNSTAESLLYLGSLGEENKNTDSVSVRLDNKLYLVKLYSVNPHPLIQSTEVQTAELSVELR
jgi:hypothetical protein